MKIQKADVYDLYDMMELAHAGKLSHLHDMKNGDYAAWFDEWSQVLQQGLGGMFVAKKNNHIIGAIGWQYGKDIYDKTVDVAQGVFWWVLPEYESSRLGVKLLEEYLLHVDELGIDAEITLGTMSSPRSIWVVERYGFSMANVTMRRKQHNG